MGCQMHGDGSALSRREDGMDKIAGISVTGRRNLPCEYCLDILARSRRTAIDMLLRNLPIQLDEEVTILLNMDKDLASAMNKWRLE